MQYAINNLKRSGRHAKETVQGVPVGGLATGGMCVGIGKVGGAHGGWSKGEGGLS